MIITYNDNEFEINEGETLGEVLKKEIEKSENEIITCNFNNEIKSLNYKPSEDGKVELLGYTDTEGKRVYVRGIMYVMSMAFHILYPYFIVFI